MSTSETTPKGVDRDDVVCCQLALHPKDLHPKDTSISTQTIRNEYTSSRDINIRVS
jgi:hypothetical protein